MNEQLQVTHKQIEEAFTEWDRVFREDPEEFQNVTYRLLYGTPETYGQECAPYFIKLLQNH